MKLRTLAFASLLLFLDALATRLFADENYPVKVERGVSVKMRDGGILRGDIFRPDAEGKFPVLLQRTPYRRAITWGYDVDFAQRAASRGYVVFIQDVRGRYTSDGTWYPFLHESEDGYDTIEWVATQPYSNGKVGMFGGSYVGATQMLAAIGHPPHLAGICPTVTASNYHNGWTYQGGAFEQWFNESWSSGLALDTMRRRTAKGMNPLDGSKVLPLLSYPVLEAPSSNGVATYFTDWLEHPNYDRYWKPISIEDHYADIQVPVFGVGAWYDIFLGGTLRNYVTLKTEAGTEAARKGQRLEVTVGGHAGGGRKIGAVDFGEKLPNDDEEAMLRWYDWLLKGEANGIEKEKPVKIFVMGKNEWREEDDWPLDRKSTRLNSSH